MNFAEQLKTLRVHNPAFKTAKSFVDTLNKLLIEDGHDRETIAYNTYSTYEKGQREPRYLVLTYMAKLLDVSTDTLLGVQVEPEQADVWKLLLDHLQPGEAPRYKTPEQDLIVASTSGKLYRVTGKDWQTLVQQADEDWQQELDQINQRRQQKLDRSIDRLLQQQRDKLKFKPDSDLGQILLWSISLSLKDFSLKQFREKFKPEQLAINNNGERCNLFTALCFVYFTGLNPIKKDSRTQDFLNAYDLSHYDLCLPDSLNTKDFLDLYQRTLYLYIPKIRCPGLEAYVAYLLDLDYDKFREKFQDFKEQFLRLRVLFLDYLIKIDDNTLLQTHDITDIATGKDTRYINCDRFFENYNDYHSVATPFKQMELLIMCEAMKLKMEQIAKDTAKQEQQEAAQKEKPDETARQTGRARTQKTKKDDIDK